MKVIFPTLFLVFCLGEVVAKSQLPVPRFVSTRASEANLRVGPGKQYPVAWTFVKPDIPVEVTAEFGNWRRVRDIDGTTGWFHKSMLKSQRIGVVLPDEAILRRTNHATSAGQIRLARGVFVKINKCRNEWCNVTVAKHKGWLLREELWGVYPEEKI